MSVYSVKGKGWRYDFTHKGTRHTEAWFKTKKEAKEAEARKRQELKNPPPVTEAETTPTDMAFGEMVNRRLGLREGVSLRAALSGLPLFRSSMGQEMGQVKLQLSHYKGGGGLHFGAAENIR